LPPWLVPLCVAPFVGSFLGTLIRRLPEGRPVIFGRSECESCGRVLAVVDLVPIVAYIAQRGRCRTCGARIAPAHLAIEVAAVGVAVGAALVHDDPLRIASDCVLGWYLLALAWIDFQYMRLPDVLTLPLVILGLGTTLVLDPGAAPRHAVAAVVGYLCFRGIDILYRWLRGRDGIGQGDAKLMAAAGAWVGLEAMPMLVAGAALLGLATALLARARDPQVNASTPVAFGPGLAVALWITWLCLS
jgi:leader peptidase (prepilin peptidase)/N-methyltransferase